ncbi:hypothetical protein [Acholeplasma equifetale]|nr:hypothetical protein [Acholeplasma equifetale]
MKDEATKKDYQKPEIEIIEFNFATSIAVSGTQSGGGAGLFNE